MGRSDHDDLGRRLQSREEEGGMAAADTLEAISDEREEQLAEALQDALSDGRSAAGSGGGDLDAEGGGCDDESFGSTDSAEKAEPDAIAALLMATQARHLVAVGKGKDGRNMKFRHHSTGRGGVHLLVFLWETVMSFGASCLLLLLRLRTWLRRVPL